MTVAKGRPERRTVPADLVEATPAPLGQWLLASPLVLYLGWLWVDVFAYYSPIPWRWLDWLLGIAVYAFGVLLPLGLLAHRAVTTLPRLFQNAGWNVVPRESVREAEQYTVRYTPHSRHRAPATWARLWARAAQGWVYLEIAAVLIGGLLLIPLFLSVSEFGFGR
jgi:hypothetical protein